MSRWGRSTQVAADTRKPFTLSFKPKESAVPLIEIHLDSDLYESHGDRLSAAVRTSVSVCSRKASATPP